MARPRKAVDKRQNRETKNVILLDTPQPLDKIKPPVTLTEDAAQVWRSFWNSSVSAALDLDSDGFSVARWITYTNEWFEITAELTRSGLLVDGSQGQKVLNPLARQRSAVETALEALEKQLGLTPAARAQLGIAVNTVKKTSAELLTSLAALPPAELKP